MTKEEMIEELEKYLIGTQNYPSTNKDSRRNQIMAMDLLASLKGYKTHLCHKRSAPQSKLGY